MIFILFTLRFDVYVHLYLLRNVYQKKCIFFVRFIFCVADRHSPLESDLLRTTDRHLPLENDIVR